MSTRLSLETGMPFDYMELPDTGHIIQVDWFNPFKLIRKK